MPSHQSHLPFSMAHSTTLYIHRPTTFTVVKKALIARLERAPHSRRESPKQIEPSFRTARRSFSFIRSCKVIHLWLLRGGLRDGWETYWPRASDRERVVLLSSPAE